MQQGEEERGLWGKNKSAVATEACLWYKASGSRAPRAHPAACLAHLKHLWFSGDSWKHLFKDEKIQNMGSSQKWGDMKFGVAN